MEQLLMKETEQLSNGSIEKSSMPGDSLNNNLMSLIKFGGFNFLDSLINGSQNLNPEKKSRREDFLNNLEREGERASLKKTFELWIEIITNSDDLSAMSKSCQQKFEAAEQLLKKNSLAALKETRDLERSYRSTDKFFKNAGTQKKKNISFVNADLDQLKDLDNSIFIDAIHNELVGNFDRLDLRENYSILVIPGYLGSNKVIEKWAKIAHETKVTLITDFQDLETPDEVMESFEKANLTGGDAFRSNVIMTTNYLVGRGKYDEVGEEDNLYLPPSAALAGKICDTLLSQVAAGIKFGCLNEVDGVRFDLKKCDIAFLEKLGLVPMVKEYGKVMAFSAKTLFNGDNIGLQTYSVVRVFDHIVKVMMDFLNRRAFQNFTAQNKNELNNQIVRYLDSVSGHNKLIEGFAIKRLEQDPVQKDMVHLDLHLIPFFPTRSFVIRMEGQKGDDGKNNYTSKYELKEK